MNKIMLDDPWSSRYVGWIDSRVASREELIKIGVKGNLIINKITKVYEYCEITESVASALEKLSKLNPWRPQFFKAAFTAIDEKGNQLPLTKQKLWR